MLIFFPKADIESDFKTKSILCMPIFDTSQMIIGEFFKLTKFKHCEILVSFRAFGIIFRKSWHLRNVKGKDNNYHLLAKQCKFVCRYGHIFQEDNDIEQLLMDSIKQFQVY